MGLAGKIATFSTGRGGTIGFRGSSSATTAGLTMGRSTGFAGIKTGALISGMFMMIGFLTGSGKATGAGISGICMIAGESASGNLAGASINCKKKFQLNFSSQKGFCDE